MKNPIFPYAYKSIIVLNGSFLDPRQLPLFSSHMPILAADGAANHLIRMGISPTYIIGDGDSLAPLEAHNLIKLPCQESSDFEKTLLFAREHALLPSLVLGVNGGEIDHILGNIQTLLKCASGSDFFFLDSYHTEGAIRYKLGLPLCEGKHSVQLEEGALISLFPLDQALLSSHGLKWELCRSLLRASDSISLRNEALVPSIEIEVFQGKVLIVVDLSSSVCVVREAQPAQISK